MRTTGIYRLDSFGLDAMLLIADVDEFVPIVLSLRAVEHVKT